MPLNLSKGVSFTLP